MQYSVVIPTNRSIAAVLPTLQSLQKQTIAATQIIIVYDKLLTQNDYDSIHRVIRNNIQAWMIERISIVSNISHDFEPGQWVSAVRNAWIQHADSEYILCIDDDNTIASDCVKRLSILVKNAKEKYQQEPLIVPTEYHRNAVRSRGYSGFSYLFGIPISYHEEQWFQIGEDYVGRIQFASSNCLFGHKSIFAQHPFNEKMSFVYEDFAMTASVHRAGIPVILAHSIIVNHHMRAKTPLEDSYIATPAFAYQKAKNRIWFVRILGNGRQKVVYFVLGLHIHTCALIAKTIRYAPGFIPGYMICYAIVRGTRSGLFSKK